MTRSVLAWASCGVAAALAACGGQVVFVEDGGGEGGAGAGSSTGIVGTSVTSGPSTATVGTSVVASSSSGGSFCDTGEFGDFESEVCNTCLECTIDGGPCTELYFACVEGEACNDFFDCVENCNGPDCDQECAEQFPEGAQLYLDLLDCAVCQNCATNCGDNDGFCFEGGPEPGPPPPQPD